MKILILGGTKEAAELARELVDQGHDVTSSLAGRTKEPEPVQGNVRIGGFGGIEGLTKYLKENEIEKLIDCTHPFARQISSNAFEASKLAGVKLEVHTREPWHPQSGDQWIEVPNLEKARDVMPKNARVLLALGSQYIDLFSTRDDVFFLVRLVDKPQVQLTLPNHELVIGKPSTNWKDELDLLQANKITHILCRNSGGTGAYAKIEAARKFGIPVIMVSR